MGYTSIMGIFIGSVIYNGDINGIKKMIVSLVCYASLIITVNFTRILPDLVFSQTGKPFASIWTVLLVTLFYLLGAYVGVVVTKKAHKSKGHTHKIC
jgi:hypothetical protein